MSILAFLFLFSAFVLVFSLISSALFLSKNPGSQLNSFYWVISCLCSIASFSLYAYGGYVSENIEINPMSLTFANSFLIAASFYQALFSRSFNKPINNKINAIGLILIVAFAVHYEHLRQHSHFAIRAIEIATIMSLLFAWQLYEIYQAARQKKSAQLWLIFICIAIELFLITMRLLLVSGITEQISVVYKMPQHILAVTSLHIIFNTITYILISCYWAEQATAIRTQIEIENSEIKALLETQDKLIHNLLISNKSAAAGALSGSLAHELNQPITAMGLNLSVLKMELDAPTRSNQILFELWQDLTDDNERIANIVKSLRSIFTKNHSENLPEIDLRDSMIAIMRLVKAECDEKSIKVILRMRGQLKGKFRNTDIQQVMLNLINNAIQSLAQTNRDNQKITITLIRRGTRIYCSFADNGRGVPLNLIPNLFTMFESNKETGMGIGLWLCQYIVNRYNSTIVHSVPSGGGAKFSFALDAS